jgi:hypothetical protein
MGYIYAAMSGTEVKADSRINAPGLFPAALYAAIAPPRDLPKTTILFAGIFFDFVR